MMTDGIKQWMSRGILGLALVCFAATWTVAADYAIYTLADLQAVTPDHLADRCLLMNDIDAAETADWNGRRGFEPIGIQEGIQVGAFTGSFLGNGHRITGLHIDHTGPNAGLFSIVSSVDSDVVIENLILDDVSVLGAANVGGLAGAVDLSAATAGASVLISQCILTSGRVTASGDWAGGLVGSLTVPVADTRITVRDCSSACQVSGIASVGGLIGVMSGNAQAMKNSATGPIAASGNLVGGLVGQILGAARISNSFSTGSVAGHDGVGGFAGANDGIIEYSYSRGEVTGASVNVGGFVAQTTGTLTYNVWDGSSSGIMSGSVAGQMDVLSSAEMLQPEKYVTWDFVSIWAMETTPGYETCPFFRFKGGSGRAEDPYRVADVYGLQGMGADAHAALSFEIVSDVDAGITELWNEGAGFLPIGSTGFTGTMDGKGHVISNLWIDQSQTDQPVGLFNTLGAGAQVQNIIVENAVVIGGESGKTGILAGSSLGKISGCFVSGKVYGMRYTGGLIGYQSGGVVSRCGSEADVRGESYTGGLIGQVLDDSQIEYGQSRGTIHGLSVVGGLVGMVTGSRVTGCSAKGTVSGFAQVGGLIGSVFDDASTVEASVFTGDVSGDRWLGGLMGMTKGAIRQCYSSGTVTGNYESGGFAGILYGSATDCMSTADVRVDSLAGGFAATVMSTGSIVRCYSTGAVSGDDLTGGLVGVNGAGDNHIRNAYWDTTASGLTSSDGGEGLSSPAMMQQVQFESWDFEDTWGITEAILRPYLLWDTRLSDLEVTGAATTATADPEGLCLFDVILTNRGPNTAYQVSLGEKSSPTLVNIRWSGDEGVTWAAMGQALDLGDLVPGDSLRLMVQAEVLAGDEPVIEFECRTDFDGNDPYLGNNTAILSWATGRSPLGSGQTRVSSGGDGSGCFIYSVND